MRARNSLLLVVFTLALVVLVVGITGLALAAPKPLDNQQATPVAGSLTYGSVEGVDWFFDFANGVEDESGNFFVPLWVVYQVRGGLEGTYRVDVIFIFACETDYLIEGEATFTGAVMGRRTSWVAAVEGSGVLDLDPPAPM